MKRITVSGVVLALVAFAFLSPLLSYKAVGAIGNPAPEQVFLFEDTNYQGNSMSFYVNDRVADLTRWKFIGSSTNWNDKISSMKIGKNAKIIFYKDVNFKKKMGELEGDTKKNLDVPNLHSYGWGDQISSFEVKQSSKFK